MILGIFCSVLLLCNFSLSYRFMMKLKCYKENLIFSATQTWWILPWMCTEVYFLTKKYHSVRIFINYEVWGGFKDSHLGGNWIRPFSRLIWKIVYSLGKLVKQVVSKNDRPNSAFWAQCNTIYYTERLYIAVFIYLVFQMSLEFMLCRAGKMLIINYIWKSCPFLSYNIINNARFPSLGRIPAF